ncbi:aminopeptidase [Vibrio tubiashii]|uniref:M18 family aminopeptidase n=1 Tax=Vibrio tubiashii ATCC 19109 TaxID=1051646 RepID=F9T4F6_9VIBR|nr:aminopeptidase [Vibrio tubiashii]AIW13318.1 aminopeptidase [Vibrio tubiashii ATCC 19109]EGU56067.1 putative aminopeptidase 2 [Vibrio tubiashii ATCC 19109]EIF04279.1 putative aminopeptidase 2 [Vibrio tubiashii NCIMB 1337 = ATCC 19106]
MDLPSDLLAFINKSPTPFHAVKTCRTILLKQGFEELKEEDNWIIDDNKKYFLIKGGASIVIINSSNECTLNAKGGRLLVAHTDSPTLKLKQHFSIPHQTALYLDVNTYASPLISTWLDRPLALAGQVFVEEAKGIRHCLVDSIHPSCTIPSFPIGLHQHRKPDQALEHLVALSYHANPDNWFKDTFQIPHTVVHHNVSLYPVADPSTQNPTTPYLTSARLDNLISCYAAVLAAIHSDAKSPLVVALFDKEEVGNKGYNGCASPWLSNTLKRMWRSRAHYHQVLARSIALSLDTVQASQPDLDAYLNPDHAPSLGNGIVMKVSESNRYCNDPEALNLFLNWSHEANIRYQVYAAKLNQSSGSTLGPLLATTLGIPCIDVGIPILAMHASQEIAHQEDFHHYVQLAQQFSYVNH